MKLWNAARLWTGRIERWLESPMYRELVKRDGWVIADLKVRQMVRR